jgi:hypothetical protein
MIKKRKTTIDEKKTGYQKKWQKNIGQTLVENTTR